MEIYYDKAVIQTDEGNITRRMLAHGGTLMIVEVIFKKASQDPGMHSHTHEQIAYITKGSFEFILHDGTSCILKAGDSIYLEPDKEHGAKCLEDGSTLVDVFTPQRDDFMNY